jgi:uncharacterized membrane protein
MIAFALVFGRWFRVFRTGLTDPEFRALLISVGVVLAIGTAFYRWEEGWSVVDSVYFCVTTLTTIGFGDPSPTTDLSKVFTIGYVLTGIGIIASFIGAVADRARRVPPGSGTREGR